MVSPSVYSQIHYKISEVTHLDMKTLQREGVPFSEAISRFLAWCGKDFWFVTWGSMDLTELQRNMVYFGEKIPFPMPLLYYDLQKLYSLEYHGGDEKMSLDQAVEEMGIPVDEEKPFHHALDDAFYTGQIMAKMGFDQVKAFISMDYYRLPEREEDQVILNFPGYSKFVSREFWDKEEVLASRKVNEVMCCCCHRLLRKKIRWFAVNSKLYVCLAVCPEHGLIRSKIRIKKSESGNVFAVRTTKLATEKDALDIAQKRDEVRKRRTERNRIKRQGRKIRKISG